MTRSFWRYRPTIAVQFASDVGDSPLGQAISIWRMLKAMRATKPEWWTMREPEIVTGKFLRADKDQPQVYPDRWILDVDWSLVDD